MTLQEERTIIETAVSLIQSRVSEMPEIGLILGSGLGDYADQIENPTFISYSDIPNFPQSTVAGHKGQFVIGTRSGKTVIAMQGRVHYYEGYTQRQITLPIRIMHRIGVKKLLLTNAAGSANEHFGPGTLMVINDHINYSGDNPLIGPNFDEDGPRFPDVSRVYDSELRSSLMTLSAKKGLKLEEGVYMMFSGPSYETPAEVRMARLAGADAVGMSTVPEAIVAAHCGISVLGISCLTNYAAGISATPLNHQEVVETAERVKQDFIRVVDLVLSDIF